MADKRISQLVDRGTIENNDVVPIVVSGASTTNKATISSIQTFMQGNLDLGVTSVGLTMPSAFVVSNSPVTTSGNISVTGAGTVSQYIRGDGSLADFPQGGGGGGSSVNYYLNGSVSQGTIGGIAYVEMNKTPILGTGTDFTINADGYIASFITDAGDPALLEIPSGNWNFETYFQASSGGGTPTFYVELYKVNSGGTATLIASNSGTPELIAFGTTTTPYFSTLAVPTTTLTLTDRLALRYYVAHAGRTITLHTENATLCQIITTFTTGLTALNGLTAQVQNFTTGTSGTDFGISSTGSTHTFNLPTASATNRGALSSADWTTFNNKQAAGNYVTLDTTQTITGEKTFTATNTNINGSIVLKSGALTGLVVSSYSPNALEIGATISGTIYYSSFVFPAGARSWNLPNASGTIALTSNLAAYLPLTGGTLTGALNGTSASFTTEVSARNGDISIGLDATYSLPYMALGFGGRSNSSNKIFAARDSTDGIYIHATTGRGIKFEVNAASTPSLEIASTGAATFSSSVTATGVITANGGGIDGTLGNAILFGNAGFPNTQANRIRSSNSASATGNLLALEAGNGTIGSYNNNQLVLRGDGNVGIGTASPESGWKFDVAGIATMGGTSGNGRLYISTEGTTNGATYLQARNLSVATPLHFFSSVNYFQSNVGIGTASPSTPLHTFGRVRSSNTSTSGTGAASGVFELGDSSNGIWRGDANSVSTAGNFTNIGGFDGIVFSSSNASIGSQTERMRITSGGQVGINTASFDFGEKLGLYSTTSYTLQSKRTGTGSEGHFVFSNGNGVVGSIFTNGSATFYNATSDYRLKEDLQEIKGLEKVQAIKVYDYKWKSSESRMDGVLAHELAEVLPYAVTGEKDEVDENGNDKMQAVDYSKIVPILIKAIQEQQEQIKSLTEQIDSLKNQMQ
jgi:hypothetical protein